MLTCKRSQSAPLWRANFKNSTALDYKSVTRKNYMDSHVFLKFLPSKFRLNRCVCCLELCVTTVGQGGIAAGIPVSSVVCAHKERRTQDRRSFFSNNNDQRSTISDQWFNKRPHVKALKPLNVDR